MEEIDISSRVHYFIDIADQISFLQEISKYDFKYAMYKLPLDIVNTANLDDITFNKRRLEYLNKVRISWFQFQQHPDYNKYLLDRKENHIPKHFGSGSVLFHDLEFYYSWIKSIELYFSGYGYWVCNIYVFENVNLDILQLLAPFKCQNSIVDFYISNHKNGTIWLEFSFKNSVRFTDPFNYSGDSFNNVNYIDFNDVKMFVNNILHLIEKKD